MGSGNLEQIETENYQLRVVGKFITLLIKPFVGCKTFQIPKRFAHPHCQTFRFINGQAIAENCTIHLFSRDNCYEMSWRNYQLYSLSLYCSENIGAIEYINPLASFSSHSSK